MKELVVKDSFICYFDILGYKEYIKTHDENQHLKLIQIIIKNIIEIIHAINYELTSFAEQYYDINEDLVQYRIFSDNIIIAVEVISQDYINVRMLQKLISYDIHQGNGSNQHMQKPNNSVIAKTQEQLASQIGISVDTLQNYKLLADMIPELDELVTTGIVTKTTALAMMRNLSEQEQIEYTPNLTSCEFRKIIDKVKCNFRKVPKGLCSFQNGTPSLLKKYIL